MKRSVIVFGASGGLGGGLLADLVADGTYEPYGTAHRGIDSLRGALEHLGLDPDRHALQVDATDFAAVSTSVERVASQSQLWAIVNLVGVPSAQRLERGTSDDIEHVLQANILPAFWTTKAMLESHRAHERRGGRIVHASSIVSQRPVPGTTPYAAAKGAVEGLVRAAAEETARHGVTINALRLGYFDAGMGLHVPEPVLDPIRQRMASGRLGTRADLAAAVAFLLSDGSEFVTGSTLDLDGGLG